MLTNAEVRSSLSRRVARRIWPNTDPDNGICVGPLEINDFSVCFWLEKRGDERGRGYYVKIPKMDLHKKEARNICPLSQADRALGKNEYDSLSSLAKLDLPDSLAVAFVKPVAYLADDNAIVTERVAGRPILASFRRCALRKRIDPRGQADFMDDCLDRLGKTVRFYHRASEKRMATVPYETFRKIDKYLVRLQSRGRERKFLDQLDRVLKAMGAPTGGAGAALTLKGLDIRNILADGNGRCFILDPGKSKVDFPEADLARFIVTCRIIFWGTPLLFLRLSPGYQYEKRFLDGYYGDEIPHQSRLLGLLIIKELLKHWYLANVALDLKTWPGLIKMILRKTYIDPFYKEQLRREVEGLGAGKRL